LQVVWELPAAAFFSLEGYSMYDLLLYFSSFYPFSSEAMDSQQRQMDNL
jgi:hypothetical protein